MTNLSTLKNNAEIKARISLLDSRLNALQLDEMSMKSEKRDLLRELTTYREQSSYKALYERSVGDNKVIKAENKRLKMLMATIAYDKAGKYTKAAKLMGVSVPTFKKYLDNMAYELSDNL